MTREDAKTLERDVQKAKSTQWFESLRDQICAAFETLEDELKPPFAPEVAQTPPGRFTQKAWQRHDDAAAKGGGGGVMSLMHGRVFEKVGVNISTVYGAFSPEFAKEIPGADKDPSFWASGISLVAHMRSPLVPAVHMNTRHIITSKGWFGGGADLNPVYAVDKDTRDFHKTFQLACDRYDPTAYKRFKDWCDDYFYIKHRQEARGVGGIFFDYLDSGDWEKDFGFTQDVGLAFLEIFPELVRRHMHKTWSDDERAHQLMKRGRYAEFNLIYDRGTRFGLMTGGNVEAILMSLPPLAAWP